MIELTERAKAAALTVAVAVGMAYAPAARAQPQAVRAMEKPIAFEAASGKRAPSEDGRVSVSLAGFCDVPTAIVGQAILPAAAF
jgi:hypothetical protein